MYPSSRPNGDNFKVGLWRGAADGEVCAGREAEWATLELREMKDGKGR